MMWLLIKSIVRGTSALFTNKTQSCWLILKSILGSGLPILHVVKAQEDNLLTGTSYEEFSSKMLYPFFSQLFVLLSEMIAFGYLFCL